MYNNRLDSEFGGSYVGSFPCHPSVAVTSTCPPSTASPCVDTSGGGEDTKDVDVLAELKHYRRMLVLGVHAKDRVAGAHHAIYMQDAFSGAALFGASAPGDAAPAVEEQARAGELLLAEHVAPEHAMAVHDGGKPRHADDRGHRCQMTRRHRRSRRPGGPCPCRLMLVVMEARFSGFVERAVMGLQLDPTPRRSSVAFG
ncbi:hypothetical protein CYMTET_11161 [Cymbomonas tetramitiformis]|uniref:Uncharacterized protein n=1 Tax=Cymbomonas tetramitiformis TaxID=36881 RepID=A0AAE0LDR0_9CHLO|nr:hypothetical protein CYMTET_11161 [Cymbomonas tetramitiformis]